MKSTKNVLVLTSTFPRWSDDTTPGFVYELSSRLWNKNRKIIVLAPHSQNSAKCGKLGNLIVHRFQYFHPACLQKLAYGQGILFNFKKSLLAKIQLPVFLFSEYLSSIRLTKRYNPDVLHAHWMLPQGIIASLVKRRFKIPLIVTIHGSDLFPLNNPLYRHLQKKVLESCNVCTVNSTETKNEVIARFPEFKDKLRVIPMGVDTNKFSNKFSRISAKKNLEGYNHKYNNKKIILFVGRLNEQKGIKYLIKSLEIIKRKIPNAKLVIIGEGDYRHFLKKISDKLNLSNDIEFLGAQQHSRIAHYYNLADVVVLPSIISSSGTEGLGLVLLEAMACGTCVIGTPTGGINSIITDGKTGLMAKQKNTEDLAEKIIMALSNEKLRNRLGKSAQKFVRKNYSWPAVAKKFDKVYGELPR